MEKHPAVSVIVPVYNVADYLERCLDSLLTQSFRDFELLLIDDGSTDTSGGICDDCGKVYENVRVFHKPNGGLSDARNYGLLRAAGDYVLFVDSDDTITADALAVLYAEAARTGADMVIGAARTRRPSASMMRFEKIARDSIESGTVLSGREYLERCLAGGALRVEAWRALCRRAFLAENGLCFKKGIAHEDEEFTPRALLCAERVTVTDYAFYEYDNTRGNSIMHAASLSVKRSADRLDTYAALLGIYRTLPRGRLRRLLTDDLTWKYIDCYVSSPALLGTRKPMRLGLLPLTYKPRRTVKAALFALSPRLYVFFVKR